MQTPILTLITLTYHDHTHLPFHSNNCAIMRKHLNRHTMKWVWLKHTQEEGRGGEQKRERRWKGYLWPAFFSLRHNPASVHSSSCDDAAIKQASCHYITLIMSRTSPSSCHIHHPHHVTYITLIMSRTSPSSCHVHHPHHVTYITLIMSRTSPSSCH